LAEGNPKAKGDLEKNIDFHIMEPKKEPKKVKKISPLCLDLIAIALYVFPT